MSETLEELKAIIAGKPEGAKSISEHANAYVKRHDGNFYWWDGSGWQKLHCHIGTRSLSDIERIIELMEINSETQRQRASSSEAYGKFIDNMGRDHKLDLMLSNSIVNQCIKLGHVSGMSEVETLKFAISAMIKLSDDDLKNKIDLAMRRVNPYSKGDL